MVGRHPAIRFRPRAVIPAETACVTLPVALSAAQGRLADVLGPPYGACAVLVGLRLGGGASVGQLDLMILARSGRVALGECKLVSGSTSRAGVNRALRQLQRYETAICGRPFRWLRERVDDSYARFCFPGCDDLPKELGLPSPDERKDWWKTTARNIKTGRFDTFAALRKHAKPTIHVWTRHELRLDVTRAAHYNSALQQIGARGARPDC